MKEESKKRKLQAFIKRHLLIIMLVCFFVVSILLAIIDSLLIPNVSLPVQIVFLSFGNILAVSLDVIFLSFIVKDINSRRKLYSLIWQKSSEVIASDLLGEVRSKKEYGFIEDYFQDRPEETKFRETMEKILAINHPKNNLLLIGAPLAGKSRMVYQWLKEQKDLRFCLLRNAEDFSYFPINPDQFLIPFCFKKKVNRILIIDDLHTYTEITNIDKVLKYFSEKNIPIIATSRTSFEQEKLELKGKEFIDLNEFEEIIIERINDIENKDTLLNFQNFIEELHNRYKTNPSFFQQDNEKDIFSQFDGNIGSIFLPLEEIEKRYRKICKDDPFIKYYLSAMKIAYSLGIYLGEATFPKKWTAEIFESIFEEKNFTIIQYNSIYSKLLSNELTYNPKIINKNLQQLVKDALFIEPVYLEKIIDRSKKIPEIALEFFDYCFKIKMIFENKQLLEFIGFRCWQLYRKDNQFNELLPNIISYLNRLLEINESTHVYNNIGLVYSELKQYQMAIASFLKAIELQPDDVEAYYNLGTAYVGDGQLKEAIKSFLKAIEFNSDKWEGYYNLSWVYSLLQQKELAIANLTLAFQRNSELRKYLDEPAFDLIRDSKEFKEIMGKEDS